MMRKKKRKLKLGNIFIAVSLVVLFSLVFVYFLTKSSPKKEKEEGNDKIQEVKKEEKEQDYQLSMVMVGDNLIHSSIYKDASDGKGGYDFRKMYELVKPIVQKYDIAYYNQETVLGGKELGISDYPTFNSPQEVGDAMIDAGFNLVSLASNHTMDSGEKAILASRAYWDSKSDVLAVGSYSSAEDRAKERIVTKNNIRYTMLNYTYGTNGIRVPSGKEYLVNVWPTDLEVNDVEKDTAYQEYKEQVKKDIEQVRDKVDVLMVAMHWGVEYTDEATAYEKDMASYLASLGVDIIIGAHPHVIQPVTWIDKTLVIYSLGNFISAQYQTDDYNKMVGLMTSLEIKKKVKGKSSEVSITNVDNDLDYTYYKNWRGFKVVPFSSSEIATYLPDYQRIHDKYAKVVKKYDNNISVKPAYGEE